MSSLSWRHALRKWHVYECTSIGFGCRLIISLIIMARHCLSQSDCDMLWSIVIYVEIHQSLSPVEGGLVPFFGIPITLSPCFAKLRGQWIFMINHDFQIPIKRAGIKNLGHQMWFLLNPGNIFSSQQPKLTVYIYIYTLEDIYKVFDHPDFIFWKGLGTHTLH